MEAVDDPLREIVLGIFKDHFAFAALDQLEGCFRLSGRFRDEQDFAARFLPDLYELELQRLAVAGPLIFREAVSRRSSCES